MVRLSRWLWTGHVFVRPHLGKHWNAVPEGRKALAVWFTGLCGTLATQNCHFAFMEQAQSIQRLKLREALDSLASSQTKSKTGIPSLEKLLEEGAQITIKIKNQKNK